MNFVIGNRPNFSAKSFVFIITNNYLTSCVACTKLPNIAVQVMLTVYTSCQYCYY